MSLMVLLPSSSFYLHHWLNSGGQVEQLSKSARTIAIKRQVPAALLYQQKTAKYGSTQWLAISIKLASENPDIAFQLVQFYQRQNSVYASQQAHLWLVSAAEQGHLEAKLLIANQLYTAGQLQQALNYLTNDYKQANAEISALKAKIYLALGKVELAIAQAQQNQDLHRNLTRFIQAQQPSLSKTCLRTISLVSDRYENLQLLEKWQRKFNAHPLSQYLCIEQVVYQSLNAFECNTNVASHIQCDELNLLKLNNSSVNNSNYIAIMTGKGLANVHYGIAYFGENADYNVFVHEITHLLGFADEYKLHASHKVCQRPNTNPNSASALNIALLDRDFYLTELPSKKRKALRAKVINKLPWGKFIADSTPVIHRNESGWHIGTPDAFKDRIGVFNAETCSLTSSLSVKPLTQPTNLRFLDAGFPDFYLQLLQQHKEKFAMPSWHYNLALAEFNQGNIEAAKKWLIQSASREKDKKRQAKILAGAW